MKCPYCLHTEFRVTDKRSSPSGIRRRRESLKCKKRFTTYEQVEKTDIYIIKKDGRRERFDEEKLRRGIERALEKRPVSKEKIDKMINEIKEELKKKGKDVSSSFVGEIVMKKLKKVDWVA